MSLNIFSGSRRVALALAVAGTLATLFNLFTQDPYVRLEYSKASPKAALLRTEKPCQSDGYSRYFSSRTSSGKPVSITICLLPMRFGEKGELMIPYSEEGSDVIWGGRSYSTEVQTYAKRLEEEFSLPKQDDDWATQEIKKKYWQDLLPTGLGYLGAGLLFFWAAVWTIGWVVRGFLGVPSGQDHRPAAAPSEPR